MLCELRIKNLALIESLELVFEEEAGLIVLTGETGAGKSIMLSAISLLAGGRGTVDLLRKGAESCEIEALFLVAEKHRAPLEILEAAGIDVQEEIIIKRVINSKGRSRIYINGSLTTAKTVSRLTAELLNMASQHDQQQLLQPARHLDFLDTLGELWLERNVFAGQYGLWQKNRRELDELRLAEQDKEQRRDFLQFQLDEIRKAHLIEGEDESLAAEKKRLKNGDLLLKLSAENYRILSGTVLDELTVIRRNMEQLVQLDPEGEKLAEEVTGYTYQAEDYVNRLREYRDGLEVDPMRLDQVNERLDEISRLKRKYGEKIEDILLFADEAEKELQQIESLEQRLEALGEKVKRQEGQLLADAAELRKKREKTAMLFEKGMEEELTSLAFKEAIVEVRWLGKKEHIDDIRENGWDNIEFYFSANPGEPARPLAKIASGGELSRLMLAMKCLLAKRDLVDTVIFDEVDSGIGGEAAEAVARKIKELAGHHQVLCITHLPQIAARGTRHLKVVKSVEEGRTQTSIYALDRNARRGEIARMLAGDSANEQTLAWAGELLKKGASR